MIQVNGIIGSEDGQFSLPMLISEVKKQPAENPIYILINSEGGDGELAFDMHDYLRGLNREIITESKGTCASAASILFLAGDKRIAGSPIMIHNPYLDGVAGDAEKLLQASEWIGKFEKRCEKFYSEKTGIDEGTISSLMKSETYISPQDAVIFGFATESKQIALALIAENKNNINQKEMKDESKIKKAFKAFMSVLDDDDNTPKMLDLQAVNGDILHVEREEGEPQVGDIASPDGTFLMPNNTTIIVVSGVIAEILETEAPAQTELELLQAQIAELTAKNEEKDAEIANLQKLQKSTDEIAQLNAVKAQGGSEWLAKMSSTYKPPGRANAQASAMENHGKYTAKLEKFKEQRKKERSV